jgi:RNA polymerase sigma factor (sigma-70 family)
MRVRGASCLGRPKQSWKSYALRTPARTARASSRSWRTSAGTGSPSGAGDPKLDNDLEDAVQAALIKLISSDKLATLHEAKRIEPWARSIFVHTVLDLIRNTRRHSRHRAYLGMPEDDPELVLRESFPAENPTPEDLASHRERLAIVARVASRLEVARVKFVEDLPEKEIAKRQGLTRDGVASQLKRMRKTLRGALGSA